MEFLLGAAGPSGCIVPCGAVLREGALLHRCTSAVHSASLAGLVVEYGIVHRVAVVENDEVAGRPAMPVGVLRLGRDLGQLLLQLRAFLLIQILVMVEERRTDVERIAAGLRV